jgi:hypothetical protein
MLLVSKIIYCWMIGLNGFGGVRKEAVVAYFKILSWHLPGGTEVNQEKPSGLLVSGLGF